MILPVYGYGEPVLRKHCEEISKDHPNLKEIIANMYETMYHAHGVGLAAPQVGLPIRIFLVDTTPFADSDDVSKEEAAELATFKQTFINATILKEEGDLWAFNEGCLSIPDVREDVVRENEIFIKYYDENFIKNELKLDGLRARVVQHEFDHIQGVLFTDKLSAFKKKLIKGKLNNISKGKVKSDYLMSFYKK